MKKTTRKVGRPKKAVRQINKTRQVGRWTDHDWATVRRAAKSQGTSVAAWVRAMVLREAARVLSRNKDN